MPEAFYSLFLSFLAEQNISLSVSPTTFARVLGKVNRARTIMFMMLEDSSAFDLQLVANPVKKD